MRMLGAAPTTTTDPYSQARIDLQATVGAQITAGDAAWNAGNYPSAVQAYQLAGQQGAAVIGPEIDAVGYPNVTQQYTQQAWLVNEALGAINAATATQAQALTAQTLANKISQLYEKAIQAGYAASNASAPSSSSGLAIGLALGAVAVLGGVIFGLHSVARKGGTRRTPPPRFSPRRSSAPATQRASRAVTRRV